MTPARRCVCVISINLSIPLGGGAEEKLQVWIRTRPAPAYPTSIATLHDEAIAQMAIALRLITLAFGLLHSVHERAHSPSLGTGGFRLERIAGWGLHPLESAALSRRTPIAVIRRRLDDRLREAKKLSFVVPALD